MLRTGFFDIKNCLSDVEKDEYIAEWSNQNRLKKNLEIYKANQNFYDDTVWNDIISTRTLLLWGSNDHSIVDSVYQDMKHNFPDFTEVKLENAGHWSLRVCSDEISSYIIDWLKK